MNGFTELVLTKLDVLSGFDEIPGLRRPTACATARSASTSPRTSPTSTTPSRCGRRSRAGASRSTRARHFADLPPAAQRYVAFVAERLGVPVGLVSVGQRRDQVLTAEASTATARALAST